MINIKQIFEDNFNEMGRFEDVKVKFSNKPDVHAFILLDKLVPDNNNVIVTASHDEIFLSAGLEELAKVATEEDIIDLIRCGIRYDGDTESFCKFV